MLRLHSGVSGSMVWYYRGEIMTKRCLVAVLVAMSVYSSSAMADGGKLAEGSGSTGGNSAGSRVAMNDSGSRGSSGKLVSGVNLGQATQEEAIEATAHYARARNLLITAIHEFDKARKIASPNELMDPVRWRNTLIDRAEDLDRVLDPQPRATKGGLKFEADPRLLPEARK